MSEISVIQQILARTGLNKYTVLNNVYVQALIVFAVLFVIINIILVIFKKYIGHLARHTKTNLDDILIQKTQQPIAFTLYLFSLKAATALLNPPLVFNEIVNSIIIIIIGIIVIRVFDVLLDSWGQEFAKRTESDLDDQLLPMIHRAIKLVLILLIVMFLLQGWGIEIGPLLASLGIAGIAVAFALQQTLSNVFGGISIILDKTIRVGDIVKLDSGEMGTVREVGLRSTKIKNFDGELLIVPNSILANMTYTNWAQPDISGRFRVSFGVAYGADVDKVKQIAMKEIQKIDTIASDPSPQIVFLSMGDFSLNFECRCWVTDLNNRVRAQEELTTRIYNALNKHKISIPFPTQTVYLAKE